MCVGNGRKGWLCHGGRWKAGDRRRPMEGRGWADGRGDGMGGWEGRIGGGCEAGRPLGYPSEGVLRGPSEAFGWPPRPSDGLRGLRRASEACGVRVAGRFGAFQVSRMG